MNINFLTFNTFFKSRICTILKQPSSLFQCHFGEALFSYEQALQVSVQREVRLLCLHEVGWSYVLLLQWEKAAKAFLQLKRESRWSKSFYCYLSSGKHLSQSLLINPRLNQIYLKCILS